jgi:hypothetical protein
MLTWIPGGGLGAGCAFCTVVMPLAYPVRLSQASPAWVVACSFTPGTRWLCVGYSTEFTRGHLSVSMSGEPAKAQPNSNRAMAYLCGVVSPVASTFLLRGRGSVRKSLSPYLSTEQLLALRFVCYE